MEELKVQEGQVTKTQDILSILDRYDLEQASIGTIASHSALDLANGAREEGFQTVAVCEKGRERTYLRYKRIINRTIILDSFKDLLKEENQKKLRDMNVIFVPNRSLTAYVPVKKIESELHIPMFGNRYMLQADERIHQNRLFEDAGIDHPYWFKSYKDIDRLSIVKATEPKKKIERAFFTATSPGEFKSKWEARFGNDYALLEKQLQTGETWIEEYVLGAQFNFNYFYSPLKDEVEFLGIFFRQSYDGIVAPRVGFQTILRSGGQQHSLRDAHLSLVGHEVFVAAA